MLWAHPQQLTDKHGRGPSGELSNRMRSNLLGSESGGGARDASRSPPARYPPGYYVRRDDLRQSVIEAMQEMIVVSPASAGRLPPVVRTHCGIDIPQ